MHDLAIFYEHPAWFTPLFAVLDARGVDYVRIGIEGHRFDPAGSPPPARVVLSRLAMSSFLRSPDHAIYYSHALFAHWKAQGARIINGADALAVDSNKARQLALMSGLGLAVPETRVVHRPADIVAAAAELRFPLVVKANVGGSGAGIMRYESPEELAAAVAERFLPTSIDGVLLVQEYVPAEGGRITRIETLEGRYLYAIDVAGGGFDLCPADACQVDGKPIEMVAAHPAPELIDAAERIARAAGLDVGGIEVMIDHRDGTPRFYDINALSNFVARPLDVLGWDPHEKLVDYLLAEIGKVK
ncbi:alpha-L-glutamate ligase [Sphingomonas sp.]|uniref:ATP-grasp domain-containing protein n=1 Tax=Sphingomonas sp. TaxID=28214 RepID=UPI001D3B3CF7|nr:alpha-L-glutamate ligase [Sphingomonas sp.]MBX9797092.1 alpha-L-glutamate ligase [Sphingomonas sp.]